MKLSPSSLYAWYRNTLRNPKYRWWIVLGTLAYLFSPLDLSPDLIPIAGQIDDIAVVSLLVAELSQIVLEWFQKRQGAAPVAEPVDPAVTVDANATTVE